MIVKQTISYVVLMCACKNVWYVKAISGEFYLLSVSPYALLDIFSFAFFMRLFHLSMLSGSAFEDFYIGSSQDIIFSDLALNVVTISFNWFPCLYVSIRYKMGFSSDILGGRKFKFRLLIGKILKFPLHYNRLLMLLTSHLMLPQQISFPAHPACLLLAEKFMASIIDILISN